MPSLLQNASIAFDLDGTLIDTAPGLIDTLNGVLERDNITKVDFPSFRPFTGRGARFMLEKAYKRTGENIHSDLIDQKLDLFLRDYSERLTEKILMFDGVPETLHALQKKGAHLSVCTNKSFSFAQRLVEAAGLTSFFDRIIGPEQTPAKKPDPRHIEKAVAGADPRTTIMVGDTITDIVAAKKYGGGSIAMTYGYALHPDEIEKADIQLSKFYMLEESIKYLLKKT